MKNYLPNKLISRMIIWFIQRQVAGDIRKVRNASIPYIERAVLIGVQCALGIMLIKYTMGI